MERDDEALLRLEEMEREGGARRFEGAMDVDDVGGDAAGEREREREREPGHDRERKGRRWGGGGGAGGKGHDATGDGEVKFKGRGSMKFREFGGGAGGRR
jgi:hypothetical protein